MPIKRTIALAVAITVSVCIGLVLSTGVHADFAHSAKAPETHSTSFFDRALTPDASVPIPALEFDSGGALVIHASPTSSVDDFDYLVGVWHLRNRKLASRLTNSHEWISFESRVEMHQILDKKGNIDKYTEPANHYEGVAMRLFDPSTRLWRIYWADGHSGSFDPPMVGSFSNGIGHFFALDTFNGKPVAVVFRWDVRDPKFPIWSQAFSTDRGKTWEWNAINVSERVHFTEAQ